MLLVPFALNFGQFQLGQDLIFTLLQHLPDWLERVAQIAVDLQAVAEHRRVLSRDQPLVHQRTDILLHGFPGHTHRFPNDSAAHFVRAVFQTLAADQVEIHQQWALLQAKFENFVRQKELV